jgi:hypothetical protein
MRSPRLVAGHGERVPAPGALAALAARLADHARACGLRVVARTSSRCRTSRSRYLMLADGSGRVWKIRVSNHYRPHRTGHDVPHFDYVSKDACSGFEGAAVYLERIARGEIAWTRPERSPRPKRARR